MPGPTSHSYFSQRLRLHYVDWGNPTAPPLVLVHGGRDHCRNWDWVAERLRDRWHVIAPDLRGHGDSQWSTEGSYRLDNYVYDLAQLIHQQQLAPVTLVAHSLGGNISIRYSGIYPDSVRCLVAIEGLGASPKMVRERAQLAPDARMRAWIEEQRHLAGRLPRRYSSVEDAFKRMQEENKHLTPEQAHHLTVHGVNQNEDGTFSWKFDNYVRSWPAYDMATEELEQLWARITCPTLLVYGSESGASNPLTDGRARHFQNATVATVDSAGHWVHHDQFAAFMRLTEEFIAL
jgi:pimeloyl-ACP methyl ester carboxylesterase